MIIYNVTVKISNEKHDEWLNWMKKTHIAEVMSTNKFIKYVFSKVVVDDEEGTNYSIQYYCESREVLESYQTNFATNLQAIHEARYKEHSVVFRTLLEIV